MERLVGDTRYTSAETKKKMKEKTKKNNEKRKEKKKRKKRQEAIFDRFEKFPDLSWYKDNIAIICWLCDI